MPAQPMLQYLWIVPLLPLLGSAINGLFGAKWPNKFVTAIAITSTGLSFFCALEAVREFFESGQALFRKHFFDWIVAGNFGAGFDLHRAVEIANAAAAVVVGKRGTATCSISELEEMLR